MKNFKKIINSLKKDNVSEYAAEAAYFSILSFMPFTIVFIGLIKLSDIEKNAIYIILNEVLPLNISEIIFNVIEEFYNKAITPVSFSILIIIWSSGKGFFSLSKGIKNIYKVDIENTFILRVTGTIYTLIVTGLILIFLLLILLGKSIYIYVMKRYYQISFVISWLYRFRSVFLIFLMTLILNYLYKIISKKKGKKHIYGAFISALIWQILSYTITIYVKFSSEFSNLYGSLSSIILIMLWVYFNMYIILMGAEINFLISNKNMR